MTFLEDFVQTLWAPWREQYIKNIHHKENGKICIFCRMLAERKDAKNHIFLRGKTAYAVLNIYPYSNGHCMVLPNRHVNDLSKLTEEELAELMKLVMQAKALLQEAFSPHGFNIGMNIGRLAGAGIPGHVHMHIVPRWKGDHNFMPVTAHTRVLSQSLKTVYKALTNALKKRH